MTTKITKIQAVDGKTINIGDQVRIAGFGIGKLVAIKNNTRLICETPGGIRQPFPWTAISSLSEDQNGNP